MKRNPAQLQSCTLDHCGSLKDGVGGQGGTSGPATSDQCFPAMVSASKPEKQAWGNSRSNPGMQVAVYHEASAIEIERATGLLSVCEEK